MSSKDPEDIPTFDEWKRKVMEVEKEKRKSLSCLACKVVLSLMIQNIAVRYMCECTVFPTE